MQSVELSYARYMFYKEIGINIDSSNYNILFYNALMWEVYPLPQKQYSTYPQKMQEKFFIFLSEGLLQKAFVSHQNRKIIWLSNPSVPPGKRNGNLQEQE